MSAAADVRREIVRTLEQLLAQLYAGRSIAEITVTASSDPELPLGTCRLTVDDGERRVSVDCELMASA